MTGTNIHIDENQYSNNSDYADTSSTKNMKEGDFVVRSGNSVVFCDPDSHSDWDGIIPHRDRGDHLPEHDEDYTEPQYTGDGTAGGSDRVVYAPQESGSVVIGWTPHNSSMTAPSISRGDAVGIILDDSSGDSDERPVLVEEGYSHSGTTYNSSNNNWIKVGTAEDAVSSLDSLVRVQVE